MQHGFVSHIQSIFIKNKRCKLRLWIENSKLPRCQQQLGKVLVFITPFSQKDGEAFCWPTPMASKTCNRRAVYLPQRGVDIKEEGPINVVTSHLPKVSFIPTGKTNKQTKHQTTCYNAKDNKKKNPGRSFYLCFSSCRALVPYILYETMH